MLYVTYGKNRLHGFRGEVVWKCWRTDDRRRMPAYTISSPMSLRLRWANNNNNKNNSNNNNYNNQMTTGPVSLTCWRYSELEQIWKYISTQCCISFHPCRHIRKQIWPCHKNGQGQPRVIGSTWVPEAVYQVSRSSAFIPKKKIFEVFHHIWAWSCDLEHLNKFSFLTSDGSSIWNLASIGLAVSEQMLNLSDLGRRSMNDLDL